MSSKRSKTIQLLAMGTAPLVLTACNDGKEVKTVKKDERFVNIQDCMKAGKPDYLCADSYLAALNRHKEIAPQYENLEDCESDFMEKYCTKNEQGKYTPKMAGFSLITEQPVASKPTSQPIAPTAGQTVTQTEQPASSGSSSGGQTIIHQDSSSGDFLTGVLLGNVLSNNSGSNYNSGSSYHSEPVYRRRDDRGSGYSTNTLSGYANSGVKPSKSIQEKVNAYSNSDSSKDYRSTRTSSTSKPSSSYSGSSYSGSSYSSSSYSKPSTISVSKSTSRGGFGSISSSRGGWGG